MSETESLHSDRSGAKRRTRARRNGELLRIIDQGTASVTGAAFFDALVRCVAKALNVRCAFVSEFDSDYSKAHTLAFWLDDALLEPFDYELAGTPCEVVLKGEIVAYDRGVVELFPDHRHELEEISAESYLAIPLKTLRGRVFGHLAVIDSRARNWAGTDFGVLRICAARAAAELERGHFEIELKETNEALEERVEARTLELQQAIKELKREAREHRQTATALRRSEARFRSLFEDSPISISEQDFSSVKADVDDLVASGISDMSAYVASSPEVLRKWARLIEIRTINKATLYTYAARTRKELLRGGLPAILLEESYSALGTWITKLSHGEKTYATVTVDQTLDGLKRDRLVKWCLAPGSRKDWSRVIVLAVDITEQKAAQRALLEAHEELEQRILERTAALSEANQALELEIANRVKAEAALRRSEQDYREMYEDAPDVYWSTGADGLIKQANRRASELFGYSHEEIVGKPLLDMLADSPDGKAKGRTVFKRFLRGQATFGEEVEFIAKDGRSIWASVSVKPYRDEHGQIVATRSIVTDITQRKRAEMALKHRLDLESLITSVSRAFVGVAPSKVDGQIARALAMIASFFGADRGFVFRLNRNRKAGAYTHTWLPSDTGTNIPPLPTETIGPVPLFLKPLLTGGIFRVTKSGELPAAQSALKAELESASARSRLAVPLMSGRHTIGALGFDTVDREQHWPDEDIRLLRLVGEIMANMLARQDAEIALQKAGTAAQAANRAKSDFLASTSHELRTPLNGILGYAQLLNAETGLTESQRDAVASIDRCGQHLLKIINGLLDLAKVESGRFEMEPVEINLPALLHDVADIGRLRASERGLKFSFETLSSLPQKILADEAKLRQVLLNLLSNAVKFTVSGFIRFRARAEDAADKQVRIRFEIEDSGIGIAKKHVHQVFEPFFQADSRASEGAGLGLAITKKLVTAMQGSIELTSRLGHGSCFSVELVVPRVGAHSSGHAATSRRVTGYEGRRRSILIADDQEDNRRVLARLLAPLGFEVSEARNGLEAVEVAERVKPDLILMDLIMPVQDGLEAIKHIRNQEALRGVCIFAVSASAFESTRAESRQVGADEFVAKPVQMDGLLEMVGRHLELSWIYESSTRPRSVTGCAPQSGNKLVPPVEQLQELYQEALQGDVMALIASLEQIERQEPGYCEFAEELRSMARKFELNRIRAYLKPLAVNQK